MMVTVIAIVVGALGTVPKEFGRKTEEIEDQTENRDRPDYSNIKISQNTEKSPGDLG